MQLTKEAIEEFRTLYEEELGETISKEDAAIRALELVTLYETLYHAATGSRERAPEEEEGSPETSA